MSENVTHALTIIGVIAMILVIIMVAFKVVNSAKSNVTDATDTVLNMAEQALNDFDDINGKTLSGASVVEYINSWYNNDTAINVTVNGAEYCYKTDLQTKILKSDPASSYKDMNNKGSAAYINPTAKFICAVTYADDGSTAKNVAFTIKK